MCVPTRARERAGPTDRPADDTADNGLTSLDDFYSNLATAAILLLGGYLGVKAFFDGSIAYNDGQARLVLLCAFNFCTGAGSSAGLAGAVNTAAKVRSHPACSYWPGDTDDDLMLT